MDNNDSKMGATKWFGWKSPVGLGIFFITTALALAILLYTLLNLVVSVSEALHPAAQSQGMSAQELQQLEGAQQGGSTGQ
jgi:hypothetical protein